MLRCCVSLRGRRVSLYPDQGSYALWVERARELAFAPQIQVQDLMERVGSAGEDIGDYLVRMNDERKGGEITNRE